MKNIRTVFFLLLGLILILGCTRDDICVDGDTPLLIIRFYDAADMESPKAVPSLRVIGVGPDSPVNTFNDRSSTLDSIGIPLRTLANATDFIFIINSEDDADGMEIGNSDMLQFNYLVQEAFVSRACGFVANFDELADNLTADTDNWILGIEINDTLVQNQLSAHVKIFH